ncbi:hypothetical protein E1218_04050 [Kribbella turkmenica]|uniref:Aminoglycoside phosphotransferase domain-containing protein n=1 Tax=Kribbella turkmenica TaxID=2530375 RepID=A0A4R4XFT4_9ACTN|nr:hypothetical protein E1218_04050 [Kribbella turkmenica]
MPPDTRTPLTEADAVTYATAAVGPIAHVEPVQGFAGNRTFRLHTAAGPVVYLKAGASVEDEARTCELARAADVPAPRILHVEPAYLLAAEVPGGPSASAAVLTQADLHPRQSYAVGDDLTGIIDWGDARYGDPPFDIAWFTMSGSAATGALLAGYVVELTGLDRTISMYRALSALMAIHAKHATGGEWIVPHITTIEAGLAGQLIRVPSWAPVAMVEAADGRSMSKTCRGSWWSRARMNADWSMTSRWRAITSAYVRWSKRMAAGFLFGSASYTPSVPFLATRRASAPSSTARWTAG